VLTLKSKSAFRFEKRGSLDLSDTQRTVLNAYALFVCSHYRQYKDELDEIAKPLAKERKQLGL